MKNDKRNWHKMEPLNCDGHTSLSHPQWAVLTCGHCFCNSCIAIIVEQYSVGSRRRAIKCAICRQTTSHTEISYVFTAQSSNQDPDIAVKVGRRLGISPADRRR